MALERKGKKQINETIDDVEPTYGAGAGAGADPKLSSRGLFNIGGHYKYYQETKKIEAILSKVNTDHEFRNLTRKFLSDIVENLGGAISTSARRYCLLKKKNFDSTKYTDIIISELKHQNQYGYQGSYEESSKIIKNSSWIVIDIASKKVTINRIADKKNEIEEIPLTREDVKQWIAIELGARMSALVSDFYNKHHPNRDLKEQNYEANFLLCINQMKELVDTAKKQYEQAKSELRAKPSHELDALFDNIDPYLKKMIAEFSPKTAPDGPR